MTDAPDKNTQRRPSLEAGFVIIGRNEGVRLALCIASVKREAQRIVYVDSGSVDGSVALARAHGLIVVELDQSRPFTAARARNAGLKALRDHFPDLAYVHFIDGDCELVEGWLSDALAAIRVETNVAAVCGRRRERFPDHSPYNQLCDKEWDTPVGVAPSVGGDALFRIDAFLSVGGFDPELIAGEEPDLCHRIRQLGWRIWRIDRDMTVHDAAMTRFDQWWQRNRRSGYATAEALFRRADPTLWRQVVSNTLWSLPVLWAFWPLLWARICWRSGPLEASFITLGKLPHMQGQIDYLRKRRRLIEYK